MPIRLIDRLVPRKNGTTYRQVGYSAYVGIGRRGVYKSRWFNLNTAVKTDGSLDEQKCAERKLEAERWLEQTLKRKKEILEKIPYSWRHKVPKLVHMSFMPLDNVKPTDAIVVRYLLDCKEIAGKKKQMRKCFTISDDFEAAINKAMDFWNEKHNPNGHDVSNFIPRKSDYELWATRRKKTHGQK